MVVEASTEGRRPRRFRSSPSLYATGFTNAVNAQLWRFAQSPDLSAPWNRQDSRSLGPCTGQTGAPRARAARRADRLRDASHLQVQVVNARESCFDPDPLGRLRILRHQLREGQVCFDVGERARKQNIAHVRVAIG